MDRVDYGLEYLKILRRQTDTSADHNTVIVNGNQVTLYRLIVIQHHSQVTVAFRQEHFVAIHDPLLFVRFSSR